MKEYNAEKILEQVICNKCGRELTVKQGMLQEGIFEAKQNFGYFSRRDGVSHQFDLCEDCYDQLIGSFLVPVTEKEELELL